MQMLEQQSSFNPNIVGASGCGKSTVAKLLTGLYPAWSGEILFDGRSHAQIDRRIFTSSVACINQDITLFEDTVHKRNFN